MVNNRIVSVDVLKVFLAAMVVAIHNSSSSFGSSAEFFIFGAINRIAVPMFFFITGYFISASRDAGIFRQINKVLCLYIAWSFLYLILFKQVFFLNHDVHFIEFIKDIFLGFSHLWYLQAIFLSLCCFVFLRRCSRKIQAVFAVLMLLVGLFVQYLFIFKFPYLVDGVYFYRNFAFFGLPFLLLGHLVAGFSLKLSNKLLWPYFVASLALFFVESSLVYRFSPSISVDLYLSLFLLCPLLFLLASKIEFSDRKIFTCFSLVATFIYLSHPLVMILLRKLGLGLVNGGFFVFIIAFGVALMLFYPMRVGKVMSIRRLVTQLLGF